MKKMWSAALAIVLMLSLCVPASAVELKSFSDVPATFWANTAIMDMVNRGLLTGVTEPDANGVAAFDPNGTMKRSHFVVVMMRYLYGSETVGSAEGGQWYGKAYEVAIQNGILKRAELDYGDLDKPMTRQEMALVLSRVAALEGKAPPELIDTSKIADWDSIDPYYQEAVRNAYSMEFLMGTDDVGTFNPTGVLNRAQACTVIYRLLHYAVDPIYTPSAAVNLAEILLGTGVIVP